jgi:hypothetical protein
VERLPDPMSWLAAGIPLSLLVDLLDEAGPRSDLILSNEPADLSWLRVPHAA